jgi:hypothetical protein
MGSGTSGNLASMRLLNTLHELAGSIRRRLGTRSVAVTLGAEYDDRLAGGVIATAEA